MATCQKLKTQIPWIIALGASGGQGLSDVRELLGELPATFGGTVMVVLHRPWHQPSELQTVLADSTPLPIVIATGGERLEPGIVYIGEPSQHITLAAGGLCELVDDPDRNFGNRTIDLLLKSVARHAGSQMIGVVLSGSLDDGSRGLDAIHDAGGLTMVRTPANSVWGDMPRNAISFGSSVDLIGNLRAIAEGVCTACAVREARILVR